jgi:hypothetical protein
VLSSTTAGAQIAESLRVGVGNSASVTQEVTPAVPPSDSPSRFGRALDRIPLWAAPIASAAVPGLGQARLGKDRFVAYLATEAYLLLKYIKDDRDGSDNASNFRAIARDVARRNFVTTPGVVPPDTIWKYYESMEKYLESGFFSMATSGPTVPETDTATFNGAQWVFARRQYAIPLDDPGASALRNYPLAVALYESRSVGQAYRWSWRNAQLEQDIYKRTIARSNEAYRHAKYDLIALIANHLLSTIDAFATVRLMQTTDGGTRVSATIPVR